MSGVGNGEVAPCPCSGCMWIPQPAPIPPGATLPRVCWGPISWDGPEAVLLLVLLAGGLCQPPSLRPPRSQPCPGPLPWPVTISPPSAPPGPLRRPALSLGGSAPAAAPGLTRTSPQPPGAGAPRATGPQDAPSGCLQLGGRVSLPWTAGGGDGDELLCEPGAVLGVLGWVRLYINKPSCPSVCHRVAVPAGRGIGRSTPGLPCRLRERVWGGGPRHTAAGWLDSIWESNCKFGRDTSCPSACPLAGRSGGHQHPPDPALGLSGS